MFEYSQIQSRPITELFRKTPLVVRTWISGTHQGIGLESAVYESVITPGTYNDVDSASLGMGFESVNYLAVVLESDASPVDTAKTSVGIESLVYEQVIVESSGNTLPSFSRDVGTIGASLKSVSYEQVVFDGKAVDDMEVKQSVGISSLNYELV